MRTVMAVVAAWLVVGCSSPSPESICKHLMSIEKADRSYLEPCVKKMTELEQKDNRKWECASLCLSEAKDMKDGLDKCEKRCGAIM